ncbi:MAG: hypothetical protein HY260_17640 [Chloroflexi bacterium]|nr:hypothetical protein [Chloroflexota bacterium]
MNDSRPIDRFSARLESLGLGALVAGLIEAGAGPLGFLAAQGLYLAEPGLGLFFERSRLDEAAAWLDDPSGLSTLAEKIRHRESRGRSDA